MIHDIRLMMGPTAESLLSRIVSCVLIFCGLPDCIIMPTRSAGPGGSSKSVLSENLNRLRHPLMLFLHRIPILALQLILAMFKVLQQAFLVIRRARQRSVWLLLPRLFRLIVTQTVMMSLRMVLDLHR